MPNIIEFGQHLIFETKSS